MGEKLSDFLNRVYNAPEHPAALVGVHTLYKYLKNNGYKNVTLKFVKDYLSNREEYSLNQSARRRFKRPRVVTVGIKRLYDADLAQMGDLAEYNDGVFYLLAVIDTFSKRLSVAPLKTKKGKEVSQALERLLRKMGVPQRLRTDRGGEFTSKQTASVLKKLGVKHQFSYNTEIKANFAERVIKNLKEKLYRYMTAERTRVYLPVLQKLVKAYNRRAHRSINDRRPIDVNEGNQAEVFYDLYLRKKPDKVNTKFIFRLGDYVRLSYLASPFHKAKDQNFSREIFEVYKRIRLHGFPLYQVKDLQGDIITGYFQKEELTKVSEFDPLGEFQIEKVLKKRTRAGRKEVLVRYLGYREKFDQWVPANTVRTL